jgi:hypothetical protein
MSDEDAVRTTVAVADVPTSAKTVQNGEAVSEDTVVLTRDAILGRQWRPKIVRVEVPEWGGAVFVKELSGKERDQFEISQLEGKGANKRVNYVNMRAKLVAYATCDENGKRLFNEADAVRLGDQSAKALTRIYSAASDLSGLTPEDVEELTKELGEDQSGNSGSTSQSN